MGFGINLVKNDISPRITRLIRSATGPQRQRALRAMGTVFMSITQGNFNLVSADFRPTPWPNKKDGSISTLKKTGALVQSFHLTVTAKYAIVANPTIYAAIHQFGSRDFGQPPTPGKRRQNIPPRPYFPVTKEGKLLKSAEDLIVQAAYRAIIQ